MRVAALWIYPVKSCGAVSVASASFGPLGVDGDRRFAFVAPDGRALTQREQPLLATVRPDLDGDALHLDLGGLARVRVALRDFSAAVEVDVWRKRVPGRAAPANDVIADYLGAAARLVRLEASAARAFADSQPVLVATTRVLARLNAALAQPVGMERFRANLVIDGDAEDRASLHGEQVALERAAPCGRCEVTTIDQASGARRGDEPLRTLNERFGGNFGLYYRVARGGRMRVGEALQAR